MFRIPVLQKSYLGKHTRKIKAQSLQSGDPIFDLECTVLSFALDSTSTSVFGELFDTAVPFSLQEFLNAVFFYKYNPVFWFMLYLILFSF